MSTVSCTWEEFKKMAKEFNDAAPTLNLDELDNAWKCLGLAYLGMHEDMWKHSAVIVLNMSAKVSLKRENELLDEEETV